MRFQCALTVLLLGCAPSRGPRVAEPPAPVTLTHVPSGTEIVAAMVAAYESATSYVDHGTSTTIFTGPGREFATSKSFTTAFVRSQVFRFEYRDENNPKRAFVIWSDGKHSYSKWYLLAAVTDDGDDLSLPLASALGVSSGTSHNIPLLLMPELGSSLLAELSGLRVEPDEDVGGHASWHLVGVEWRGAPIEIWVDKDTRLIRRIRTRTHFGPETRGGEFDTVQTIDYDPTANEDVDPALLLPPDVSNGVFTRQQPPWIGIRPEAATTRLREVVAGGPAEQAGLKPGDEILSISGHVVSDGRGIADCAANLQTDVGVPVVVRRDGVERTLTLVPRKRPRPSRKKPNPLLNKPAPDVTLLDTAGSQFKLSSLRGHVVVLEFWATWCAPCEALAPRLNDANRKYAAAGVRVFGVSDEDAATIQTYVAGKQLSYDMAIDPNDDVSVAFHIDGLPTLVLIDKQGTVRYVGRGLNVVEDLLHKLTK